MRSYKIESYVPEENFYQGKDARFWSSAFEGCFVVDFHYGPTIIASSDGSKAIKLPSLQIPALLNLFTKGREREFLILPFPRGTLLVYPAWPQLEMGLVFLLNERVETVEKAYKNAQRYAFSQIFDAERKTETTPQTELEAKLCTLRFYTERLFGAKRETNVIAHVLMIANLVGCRLHEMTVSRMDAALDEREMERLDAYLFCTFMTMRRYNGKISALPNSDGDKIDTDLQHVPQEYGLRIQQSMREKITKPTAFDLPAKQEMARFLEHPVFANYQITEGNGTICLHIPLKQKALLSSISVRGTQREMMVVLFPVFPFITTGIPDDPQ